MMNPTKKQRVSNQGLDITTRRIRVYPATDQQRTLLPKWFGTARWTYNECLRLVKQNQCTPTRSGGLREALVNDSNYANVNQWVLETPRDIRAGAYQDLINAYSSNYAKQRINPKHQFEIHHRSRKDAQERIYIDKRTYNRGVIYPTKFGKVPFRSAEQLPAHLTHDAHLIRTRLNHYYLCITVDVERDENQVPAHPLRVASIDPGVRTPHMLYDPTGKVIAFGSHAIGRVYRLCHYLDKLQSSIARLPRPASGDPVAKKRAHRTRWRMRNAWRRASLRIRNLVDEYHKQVIHFVVTHYDIVLLPALETSRLVLRMTRRLTTKTARAMCTWGHYRFRQRLLWKARVTGCKVVVCKEDYTSMTCGRCGHLNRALVGGEVFHCPSCHLVIGRDANGARSILLKNASRFGFSVEAALGLTPSSTEDAWPSRPQASAMK